MRAVEVLVAETAQVLSGAPVRATATAAALDQGGGEKDCLRGEIGGTAKSSFLLNHCSVQKQYVCDILRSYHCTVLHCTVLHCVVINSTPYWSEQGHLIIRTNFTIRDFIEDDVHGDGISVVKSSKIGDQIFFRCSITS